MARPKKKTKINSAVSARITPQTTKTQTKQSLLERVQSELDLKSSYLNLILGALIVLVIGVLVFNYFNNPKGEIGTSQQTTQDQTITDTSETTQTPKAGEKYTVKSGDTLHKIAQNIYGDGSKYTAIAEANKLSDPGFIVTGQELQIPKIETKDIASNTDVSGNPTKQVEGGTGGATNQTAWGETITGTSYKVQTGDWLSTIAGRAYGDMMTFDKIAKANNISNPDVIEVGTVLQIPR